MEPFRFKKQGEDFDEFQKSIKRKHETLPEKRDFSRLIFYIIVGVFVLLILIVLIPSKKRNLPKEINQSNNNPQITQNSPKPTPELPKGKMGEWAKSLVYIESGHVVENKFFAEKTGSGFVISKDGLILTNEHVIDQSDYIAITLFDGTWIKAEFVKADQELDLALLKISSKNSLACLRLQDEYSQIGQSIIVMGYPLGSKLGKELTITQGIISSIRKNNAGEIIWYQTDAAVNHGNSGGPFLDAESGSVLGIVTLKVEDAENIGFARPIPSFRNSFLNGL